MATRYRGTPRQIRALEAYLKLVRASQSVASRLQGLLSDEGLTLSQVGVLDALHHRGPMVQAELAGKLLMSPSNLTTVVDNLERRGLVVRERTEEDRRCVQVSLTRRGKALATRVFPAHAGRIVECMGALSKREQEELGRLCRKLGLYAAALADE
ncbi:MAG: MarR family winged helix-turn-helix transcriptional regulator [Longimicrobiales bacterium]